MVSSACSPCRALYVPIWSAMLSSLLCQLGVDLPLPPVSDCVFCLSMEAGDLRLIPNLFSPKHKADNNVKYTQISHKIKKKKRESYKKIQALFPAGSICVVCSAGEFLLWEISTAPRGLREMCWRGSSAPFFQRPSNLVPSRLWWPCGLWMCLGPENEHRTNTQSESRGLELEPWLCPSLMDIQCWPGASGISRELFSSGTGEISSLASPRPVLPLSRDGFIP